MSCINKKNRGRRVAALSVLCLGVPIGAYAQRANENAVAEASDAFGTAVGREVIGLYTTTSARGFNPSEAGNLRIAGLYFDQISQATPVARIVRGSTVHVGISAQGFPFPAPTGVVDFQLRTPGNDSSVNTLLGIESYGQRYVEVDAQAPLIADTLSASAGFGYLRSTHYNISVDSNEWNAGAIALWRPTDRLTITPFWSYTWDHNPSQKPNLFLGHDGWPKYRAVDLPSQSWADYRTDAGNSGVLLRYVLGEDWLLETGVFRSEANLPTNFPAYLDGVNSAGEGEYSIAAVPPRHLASTSGEARLTRKFDTEKVRNSLYLSVKGRDRESESGGTDRRDLGPATTLYAPQLAPVDFHVGPTSHTEAHQITPEIAYEGVWRGVGQMSLGLQKSFYNRTIEAPGLPDVSSSSQPWLYNAGAALYLSKKAVLYSSLTRGLEEFADAPTNAANRDQPVPAQLTRQVDAGVRYQFTPRLQMVAGAFQIDKPYFNLDRTNVYRQVGDISNRGLEFSFSGALTDRFTVVAGYIYIQPEVSYAAGAGNQLSAVAIGPIPGLFRANFQYRPALIPGLIFDSKIESTSSRYARYPDITLPEVTTIDVGTRYNTHIFGKSSTWRLQLYNLSGEYALTPSASGQLSSLDGRRFEFSLAIDI